MKTLIILTLIALLTGCGYSNQEMSAANVYAVTHGYVSCEPTRINDWGHVGVKVVECVTKDGSIITTSI